ncbi:MAG TPA: hypothetical protein DDX98_06580 [Bacteroidales bacterium]|jgi:hypothetical protein|nr:hypothetical protein [Bacteroidales bacterium]
MEPLVFEATSHLPEIVFNPDGRLKMEGRCIPEDVFKLFNPMIEYVRELHAANVTFDVNLEYFNTATSKKLMELFKTIDANNKVGSILINWHFEEGDEDSIDMAEIYEESLLRSEFRYHEYAEA